MIDHQTPEIADPVADDRRRRRSDRHGSGRRTRDRRRRRRQVLFRVGVALFAVVAVALAVVWAATTFQFGGGDGPEDDPTNAPRVTGDDLQPTLVVATFDDANRQAGAELVLVLAHDHERDEGTVLLVPSSVVADVPGHGLLPLGDAFAFGDGPLLELSLDNLLGLDFDGWAGVSEQGWSALFSRLGGLTLDVPEQLAETRDDGTRQVRFQPGEQFLDGPRLAEYLTFEGAGEGELLRFPRVQRVLEAALDAIAADPALLDEVFVDDAPMLDTPDPGAVRSLLELLAEDRAAGRLETRTLPVTPVGSGEEGAFRLDEERSSSLIEDQFANSRPGGASQEARRLQILNGNGIPGIGQQVAERLQPAGFRVVLTRNADRFDHDTTRIIVYRDTPAHVASAREIQELLGVGTVELSEVPLDVADVTIIVGQDFPG